MLCGRGWDKGDNMGDVGEGGEGAGGDQFLKCLDKEDSYICSREMVLGDDGDGDGDDDGRD